MTLDQWLKDNPGAYVPRFTLGLDDYGACMTRFPLETAVFPNGSDTTGLYHLDDYKVSLSGHTIVWLVPSNSKG